MVLDESVQSELKESFDAWLSNKDQARIANSANTELLKGVAERLGVKKKEVTEAFKRAEKANSDDIESIIDEIVEAIKG